MAYDPASGFQGAAAGGAGGSAFGPVGAGVGIALGGLIGGFAGGAAGEENEKAQRELLRAQERLNRDAALRRFDVQQGRSQALAQQLGAFNPMNQQTAQLMGPEYAFSGDQLASMAKNPMPAPQIPSQYADKLAAYKQQQADLRAYNGAGLSPAEREKMQVQLARTGSPSFVDPKRLPQNAEEQQFIDDWLRKEHGYQQAQQSQQDYIRNNTTPLPPGPAALGPRAAPQKARRAV